MLPLPTDYELTFEEGNGFLRAVLRAPNMTEAIAWNYFPRMAEEATRRGLERILFIRDVPELMPVGTLFQTTTDFVKMMEGKRVAFVNPHPHIHEDLEFSMLVAINRGADYQLFTDEGEAERWLLRP